MEASEPSPTSTPTSASPFPSDPPLKSGDKNGDKAQPKSPTNPKTSTNSIHPLGVGGGLGGGLGVETGMLSMSLSGGGMSLPADGGDDLSAEARIRLSSISFECIHTIKVLVHSLFLLFYTNFVFLCSFVFCFNPNLFLFFPNSSSFPHPPFPSFPSSSSPPRLDTSN